MSIHAILFKLSVDIIVLKDGSEYRACAPSFKGLHVFGNTKKSAIKNAKDAIIAYVISLVKHNEPIPCCQILDEDMLPDDHFKKYKYRENISIPTEALQAA